MITSTIARTASEQLTEYLRQELEEGYQRQPEEVASGVMYLLSRVTDLTNIALLAARAWTHFTEEQYRQNREFEHGIYWSYDCANSNAGTGAFNISLRLAKRPHPHSPNGWRLSGGAVVQVKRFAVDPVESTAWGCGHVTYEKRIRAPWQESVARHWTERLLVNAWEDFRWAKVLNEHYIKYRSWNNIDPGLAHLYSSEMLRFGMPSNHPFTAFNVSQLKHMDEWMDAWYRETFGSAKR